MSSYEHALAPLGRRSLPELITREQKRSKKRRLIWAAMGATLIAASVGTAILLRPRPIPLAARFRTQAPAHGDLVREVRATGHLEAVSTVQVGAEISGHIAAVDVDFNDRVKQGQILARFDRAALEAQVEQTRATLAAVRANVELAEIDAEQAHRTLQRTENLFQRGVISPAEHEDAAAAAHVSDRRVDAARFQLKAQSASHALATTNLGHAVIRSPIDGVIITRNVDPGQTVASALATPILFTVAADLSKMRVIAAVDEADIGEVKEGQRARFTVNAYANRVFEGTVVEVRNSPVIVQDVVTYGTVVEVENAELLLKPGMTASVRVLTASAEDADLLPSAAFRFTPPGEKSSASSGVWMLANGSLRRIELEPGLSDGQSTVIRAGALPRDATVIVELTPEGRNAYGLTH